MGVRKPLEKQKDIIDIDALIDKGAKVKEDFKKVDKNWTIFNVRISNEMLKELDSVVSQCVGMSRNGWILSAIHEKMKVKNE